MRLASLALPALVAALLAAGCGSAVKPLQGTVTLDGAPLEGATVVFFPADGDSRAAGHGVTDAQGNFKVVSAGKQGLPAGEYKVLVTKSETLKGMESPPNSKSAANLKEGEQAAAMKAAYEAAQANQKAPPVPVGGMPDPNAPTASIGKNILPDKYGSLEKTPLKVTVPAPNNQVELKLTKS